ncbi:hypothetical protein GQ44DRAFT_746275 [Phaeosphaeriaceae sp. PMI808]|nr:hypothetical protein GQ44DRAFT_746275 [Phaeosphaeriaceae sp. PMI808]
MPPILWRVQTTNHPGSTQDEIEQEPDWKVEHRIGYRGRHGRKPGVTHEHHTEADELAREARKEYEELPKRAKKGNLVNFRDTVLREKDLHLRHPENRSLGWRFVLQFTECWVKNNAKPAKEDSALDEEKRKRKNGEGKHHDAYAGTKEDSGYSSDDSEKLQERYTPQEIALLRMLRYEKDHVQKLEQNDGKRKSPQKQNRSTLSIDEVDQFSLDNWLPRSSDLIRLTVKHPLNAEAHLSHLSDAGIITPMNSTANTTNWILKMANLYSLWTSSRTNFNSINIPVALACDGNRRKELNMIKKSKGFSWGSRAVSCAYWEGPLLKDVLLRAGIPHNMPEDKRFWVNFEGADEPSEDHSYPLCLIIPGYPKRIWISKQENESHYHIWDNRILPSFIMEKNGEFAETLFRHPNTACNEQNLNSVVAKPAQGERIPLISAHKGQAYRIEGYAYDSGGYEAQRVEVLLDDGETWLYCIRKFLEAPIRHGNNILVRCFNVFKNTQPKNPNWNIMGMMNNCRYVVKLSIVQDSDCDTPTILFRHPVEPGTADGGWVKPSVENQIASAKEDAGAPENRILKWHPGGKAAILGHAGKVHAETSNEFESIHGGYAYQKLGYGKPDLGLGTFQHVQLGFHMMGRIIIRSYTPTKPLLLDVAKVTNDNSVRDGSGTFELTIKTYFPTEVQPGGAMSNILDCMPIGEEIEIRGPTGETIYNGNGSCAISRSSTTPGCSLIAHALLSSGDSTQIRVVDADKSEKDILLRDELDKFQKESEGRFEVSHVLSHASEEWDGRKGHVNAEIVRKSLFEPGDKTSVFLCDPSAMTQKAALPALRDWGFKEDENVFGF